MMRVKLVQGCVPPEWGHDTILSFDGACAFVHVPAQREHWPQYASVLLGN